MAWAHLRVRIRFRRLYGEGSTSGMFWFLLMSAVFCMAVLTHHGGSSISCSNFKNPIFAFKPHEKVNISDVLFAQWTHKQKITKKTDAALTLMKTPASIFTMTTNWATLWTETENLCSPCP